MTVIPRNNNVSLPGKLKLPPRFGCRFFAYMTPAPYDGQDKFLKKCLLKGRNALREQSARTAPEPDRENSHNWEHLLTPEGQPDGWGMAAYEPGNPQPYINRQAEWAAKDKKFKKAARDLGQAKPIPLLSRLARLFELSDKTATSEKSDTETSKPVRGFPIETLLAHVRVGPNSAVENAHPFKLGEWAFMHNGFIPKPVEERIEKEVRDRYLGVLNAEIQGTTDSERIFYYLLGRIRDEHGALDPLAIGTKQLMRTFAQVVNDVIEAARQEKSQHIVDLDKAKAKSPFGPGSRLQVTPSTNFVLTNGDVTLASTYGHGLYMGKHRTPDGREEVLLASEKIQPGRRKNEIEWWEVPEEHVLLLERRGDKIQITIEPM